MTKQKQHNPRHSWSVIICCLCMSVLSVSSFASVRLTQSQHLLNRNDTIIRYEIQGVSAADSGEACVWDFSTATVLPREYPDICHLSADSLGLSNHFLHARHRYRLVADTLFCTGYETAAIQLCFARPEKIMVYPFAYQDTLYSTFSGYGEYTHTMPFRVEGTSMVFADGMGTLLLPDMTLDSVLRIHTQRQYRQIDEDTTDVQCHIYRWFHPNCTYPIIELIDRLHVLRTDSTRMTLGLYYPFEQEAVPQNSAETTHTQAKEITSPLDIVTDIETMPNPVSDQLQIRYILGTAAQVGFSLHYEGGLCAYRSDIEPQDTGTHLYNIDVHKLPKGIYVLYIYANEQVLSKDILKL